jgi:hypothetical protein
MTRKAVTAEADSREQIVIVPELHCASHVRSIRTLHDYRRMDINRAIPDLTRMTVTSVAGNDYITASGRGELPCHRTSVRSFFFEYFRPIAIDCL